MPFQPLFTGHGFAQCGRFGEQSCQVQGLGDQVQFASLVACQIQHITDQVEEMFAAGVDSGHVPAVDLGQRWAAACGSPPAACIFNRTHNQCQRRA